MGVTSSEVKNRYNKKVYKQWNTQIKNEVFDKIEELRTKEGLSRSAFLEMLINHKYNSEE